MTRSKTPPFLFPCPNDRKYAPLAIETSKTPKTVLCRWKTDIPERQKNETKKK